MPVTQIPAEEKRAIAMEASITEDNNVIELSFSSEYPVKRGWGIEILDHSPGAADLSRANTGACNLLWNHCTSSVLGIVEQAWIDSSTRKGRARVRFDSGEDGQERKRQVVEKTVLNVSCFYRIKGHREQYGDQGQSPTITITAWELMEISLCPCPEDPTVGVGRSANATYHGSVGNNGGRGTFMDEELKQQAIQAERDRIKLIGEMGKRYGANLGQQRAAELAEKAIADGLEEAAARSLFADAILDRPQQSVSRPAPQLDFSAHDQRNYSLARAMKLAVGLGMKDVNTDDCGFELEASRAIAKVIGADPKGVFVPVNDLVIQGRDALRGQILAEGQRATFQVGTQNLGGYTVETMLDTSRMVDFLFNQPRCKEAGITMLMGLQGNVDIPTEDGSGMGITWVAEDGSLGETNTNFGLINLRPKTAGAYMRVTRQMMLQTELSIEAYMRSRLQIAMALGIDNAVIAGTGLGNQPTGILNTAGIGSVALGTNGGAPTYDALVDVETVFGNNNMDQLGNGPTWMLNPKGRGKLRKTLQNNISGAAYLWERGGQVAGDGEILGYKALTTNQIPSNLTKGTGTNLSAVIAGYWNQVFLGQWGVVDLVANPFADDDFKKGAIKIRIFTTLDVLIARAKAFVAITDMVTT